MHQAGGHPGTGRRERRGAASAGGAARSAPPLGGRRRGGARHSVVGLARTPGTAQRAQRDDRAGRAHRARDRRGRRRRAVGGGGQRVRRIAQPLSLAGPDRFGRVRRRQPLDQRPPGAGRVRAYETRPVALLVGGHDRGVDYAPLGTTLATRTLPTLVVTMPDNGPRIGTAVRGAADGVEVVDATNLERAVETAFTWAASNDGAGGGVVLLSPAAPSFGRFTDFRARAAAFAEAVARCGRVR